MGTIVYPVEELARQIDHIIREEASKPVMQARKLQEEMEDWLSEKLHIPVGHKESQENSKKKRLENAREPVGTVIRTTGHGFTSYRRDPITGKVIWDDLPVEYQFRKRNDLSQLVWDAVEDQEANVLGVIRGGRELGRDVKQIAGDLERYINYKNGGERVVGRWMGMFPNTEAGRKAGWEREYLKDHGGFQPGSDAAKALLKQPDAKAWLEAKMQDKTQRGTPRLPPAVRAYANRLGKAGLDYRAIRIARTETTAMVADEQCEIAENSDISTGEMDWVMDRGRDAWNCNCEKYSEMSPWKVDDPDRPEIPLHPNCMCQWVPRLKTDEEIIAAFKEEMAEDLALIDGTEEQQAILDRIDWMERDGEDVVKPSPILTNPDGLDGDIDETPPVRINRSPDYSKLSYDQAVKKEYEYLQEMTRKSNYTKEYMSIITNKNEVAGTWEGGKIINSDTEMENILRNSDKGSISLLHTHLRDISFSRIDLTTLSKYESIKDISAKCPGGNKYYVSIGNGIRPNEKDIKDRIMEESIALLKYPRYNDMKPDDVRWASFYRERNYQIKKLFGWILE